MSVFTMLGLLVATVWRGEVATRTAPGIAALVGSRGATRAYDDLVTLTYDHEIDGTHGFSISSTGLGYDVRVASGDLRRLDGRFGQGLGLRRRASPTGGVRRGDRLGHWSYAATNSPSWVR